MTHSTDDYYFGCWGEPGHFLWTTAGRIARDAGLDGPRGGPMIADTSLDCGYAPGACAPRYEDPRTIPNGAAVITRVGDWTILSFWDNSADKRPGSHSTFICRANLTFDEMVERTRRMFPSIWKRYTFEVVPATPEQLKPVGRRR